MGGSDDDDVVVAVIVNGICMIIYPFSICIHDIDFSLHRDFR